MIVVDSSVWVDYFTGRGSPQTSMLDRLLGVEPLIMGDLILAEVLQGLRRDDEFELARQALLELVQVSMVGTDMALASARNYRLLRQRGVTVRKTIDVMIATWCIEHGHLLLSSDRDFDPCVTHLGLRTVA